MAEDRSYGRDSSRPACLVERPTGRDESRPYESLTPARILLANCKTERDPELPYRDSKLDILIRQQYQQGCRPNISRVLTFRKCHSVVGIQL